MGAGVAGLGAAWLVAGDWVWAMGTITASATIAPTVASPAHTIGGRTRSLARSTTSSALVITRSVARLTAAPTAAAAAASRSTMRDISTPPDVCRKLQPVDDVGQRDTQGRCQDPVR